MKIKFIEIKNFRCFNKLKLVFSKYHALIGENASGKTAVLEAINLATSSGSIALRINEQDFNNLDKGDISIKVIFNEPFLTRLPDGYATQDIPCKGVLLTVHRRKISSAGKTLSPPFVIERTMIPIAYQTIPLNINVGDSRVNIPPSVSKTKEGYQSPRKTSQHPFKFTKRQLSMQNDLINYPNIFYFGRDREKELKVSFNSLLQKITRDLNWRYRKNWSKEDTIEKWDAFYSAVIATVEDPKNSRIMKPIQDEMESLIGQQFDKLELSLLDVEQPFSRAFFSKRDSTNQIDQKRLGSGVSILLAYFLLETIGKLSKEQILFLVDEPELHLHPQLQIKLFKRLQESDFQIIYSTQSDCFVDISKWRNITRFSTDFSTSPSRKSLKQVLESKTTTKHLDEIKKWHQHQSIFFREDNQLFFARKCLLVEGPAEKYGVPVLAKKLGKDLGGITILSCNGKTKIPYYQLFCKAFKIPFFTLFDLDGKQIDRNDNKRPGSWASKDALATFGNSFESSFGVTVEKEHKTSKLLEKIDSISPEDVPQETVKIIGTISTWALNDIEN